MTLTSIVALAGLFSVGITASILGAFKLELTKSLDIDNAKIGILVSTLTFTSVIMSLLLGVLIDMTGYRFVALAGFLFTSAAVYLLVSARRYSVAVFGCVILGIGGMSLNSFGSTLITEVLFGGNSQSLALTVGHAVGSVGAMSIPLVMGLLLVALGFKRIGHIFSILLLVPVPFVLVTHFPSVSSDFEFLRSITLLSDPVILVAGAALYCYIGAEASYGAWTTTYVSHLGVGKRTSELTLTLFWMSLLIGRLFAAKFITPVTELSLLTILASIGIVNSCAMIFNKNGRLGILMTIIGGLTLGPVFPIIVGRVFSVVDPSLKGSTFGILLATGLMGAGTVPAAIGFYSRGKEFRKSLVITLGAVIGMLACIIVLAKLT